MSCLSAHSHSHHRYLDTQGNDKRTRTCLRKGILEVCQAISKGLPVLVNVVVRQQKEHHVREVEMAIMTSCGPIYVLIHPDPTTTPPPENGSGTAKAFPTYVVPAPSFIQKGWPIKY